MTQLAAPNPPTSLTEFPFCGPLCCPSRHVLVGGRPLGCFHAENIIAGFNGDAGALPMTPEGKNRFFGSPDQDYDVGR